MAPKVVLTGGSKGLGLAIKNKIGQEYEVVDFSRTSGVDLTKEIPEFDCDLLICCAGVWKNDWRLNYEVPKEMAENMPKERLVIFILSNAAYQSFGNDDYTASKSGLLQFARRKQREGCRVATISPGTINTGFWDGADTDNRKKGALDPGDVAELVYQIIKSAEKGALVRELIVTPEVKNV